MFTQRATDEIAAAARLLAALDEYEQALLATGPVYDPELYAGLAAHFERLRPLAIAVPGFSVSWVGLLISRVDFTHSLFKAKKGDLSTLGAQFEAHLQTVVELKQRCAKVIGRS
jgi:hypothetical protein